MKRTIVCMVLFGWVGVAQAELWRYEDASGAINFTDSLDNIPPQYRQTASKHTIQEPQPQTVPQNTAGILAERRKIIERFTPAQAKAAVHRGLLTVEEVQMLVDRGALRASDAGDAIRFAGKPAPRKAGQPDPGLEAANTLEAADTRMLRELAGMSDRNSLQVEMAKDAVRHSFDPEKVKLGLMGTGALALAMMILYPFILRQYRDDSTRRIIRTSFLFLFVIIATTGNALLLKDDLVKMIGLTQGAKGATVLPAGERP